MQCMIKMFFLILVHMKYICFPHLFLRFCFYPWFYTPPVQTFRIKPDVRCRWERPSLGWFKLNVDGLERGGFMASVWINLPNFSRLRKVWKCVRPCRSHNYILRVILLLSYQLLLRPWLLTGFLNMRYVIVCHWYALLLS